MDFAVYRMLRFQSTHDVPEHDIRSALVVLCKRSCPQQPEAIPLLALRCLKGTCPTTILGRESLMEILAKVVDEGWKERILRG